MTSHNVRFVFVFAMTALVASACEVEPMDTCYSPEQNTEIAGRYEGEGCPCTAEGEEVCAPYGDGYRVPLFCRDGRWHAGVDGPCMPELPPADTCFGPHQHLDQAYEPESEGCICWPESSELCVSSVDDDGRQKHVALVCDHGAWIAVEDGACFPTPESL